MQEGNQAGPRLIAGRYAVLGELGRGGIGVVWRAQDRVIGRQVALKELRIPPGLGQHEHEVFTERVLREARTAGALNDPAIVTVYDVVPEGGAMYIVMELIEATTLADIVAGGPLDEQRATAIGSQVLSALETAHAAGIVHRDIKPSNIMVLPGDRVKLTDFGIAQAMDDPSLTATGGIMGSPGYMAPELFHGDPPSPSTDLWSLGATLFHVVEGQAPFQRDTTAATMHAIMYDDPQLHRCSGPLAAVIMGLLVHSPDQRLTAAQVKARLSGPAQPGDVERTDVLPVVAADAERTALVDRERTTAVTRRPRSTRPWDGDNEANEFTEVVPTASAIDAAAPDAWGDKPRNGKRRAAVIAGVVVVVMALIGGVAFALTRPSPNAVAAPPPSRGSVTSTPSSAAATSTSAAPTTTSAAPTSTDTAAAPPPVTTHPSTRAQGGGKSLGGGAPPPPPAPPASPTLSYVQIFRYVWSSGEGHATLSGKQSVPSGYTQEGPLGDLVTTQAPNTMPFYLCEVTGSNPYYFSSTSSGCEGLKTIALEGYIYGYPPQGVTSEALYRCTASTPIGSKYDSFDSNCEGNGHADGRLGYVV